jgi:hypothetical protein
MVKTSKTDKHKEMHEDIDQLMFFRIEAYGSHIYEGCFDDIKEKIYLDNLEYFIQKWGK